MARENIENGESGLTTRNKLNSNFTELYGQVDKLIPNNIITVAKSGAQFTSIKNAIDSITDNSSTNRYSIQISPGEYTIDNSLGAIALKSFTNIVAVGIRSVIFIPSDPTKDMFTGNVFSYIEGIVFSGNTGTSYIVRHTSSGVTSITNCVLRDCSNGFIVDGTDSYIEINNLAINNPLGTTTIYAIRMLQGRLNIVNIIARVTSKVTILIDASGDNSIVSVINITSISTDVGKVMNIYDGASVFGSVANISGCNDGLVIYGNDTTVRLDGYKIVQSQNDGLRITTPGTGIDFSLYSGVISKSGRYNFNIENADALVTGTGFTELSKSFVIQGARVYTGLIDITEGDEGFNIGGELHVGSPMNPAESVLGGGDSHTNMLVYTFNGVEKTYTDKTNEAKSNSGSTFSFDGITSGNCVYIANLYDMTFEGVKVNIGVAAQLGSGVIIAEFWNGTTWEEFNGCTVKSSAPFLKYAKNYFSQSGSYHIKYNPFIRESWAKNDPISLGTDYYWMRYRISSDINVVPVLEQIKIHTSRAEINTDGTFESHMDARTYKKLVVDAAEPIEGSMKDSSIYVDENIGVSYNNNRFTSAEDSLGISFELPEGCDTSAPLIFVWKGKFASAGDVNFTVRRKIVKPDDPYTNSEPSASGESLTLTSGLIAIDQSDVRKDFRVDVDISDAIPSREDGFGDEIWITLQYPTRGAGNFDYTKLSVNYLSDFNGRHIRQ